MCDAGGDGYAGSGGLARVDGKFFPPSSTDLTMKYLFFTAKSTDSFISGVPDFLMIYCWQRLRYSCPVCASVCVCKRFLFACLLALVLFAYSSGSDLSCGYLFILFAAHPWSGCHIVERLGDSFFFSFVCSFPAAPFISFLPRRIAFVAGMCIFSIPKSPVWLYTSLNNRRNRGLRGKCESWTGLKKVRKAKPHRTRGGKFIWSSG